MGINKRPKNLKRPACPPSIGFMGAQGYVIDSPMATCNGCGYEGHIKGRCPYCNGSNYTPLHVEDIRERMRMR